MDDLGRRAHFLAVTTKDYQTLVRPTRALGTPDPGNQTTGSVGMEQVVVDLISAPTPTTNISRVMDLKGWQGGEALVCRSLSPGNMELSALPEVVLRVFGGFPVLAVFCTIFALAFNLKKRWKKCGNYPPGPRALPFLGNLLQVDLHNPHLSFAKLRKKYGDVMSLDFGWTNVVVLSGYKALKEALVKKSEDFAGRPELPVYEKIFKRFGEGIVFAKYGDWWKAQRKFALLTLKHFGLGKKSLELRIVE
ncbi:cytochrome P450 2D14-like [Rhinoraja longicauda]